MVRYAFAPERSPLATRFHNLAGIAFAEGKPDEAVELEEKALSIWLKRFGEDHPHVRISREHLARYRSAVG